MKILLITLSLIPYTLYLIPTTLYLIPTPASAATIAKPSNLLTINTGLVGWWTFDGKNMASNVTDSSGQGNNGYMSGFTSTSSAQVVGKLGQALKFDGSNDYVNIPVNSSLNLYTKTISFWVKPKVLSGIQGLINEQANYSILFSNKNLQVYWKNGSNVSNFLSRAIGSAEVWKHITVVYSVSGVNVNIDVYLNGVALAPYSDADGLTSQGAVVRIGNNSGYYLNGSMDDVRVYNRALSASEIQQLYNIGAASKVASTPKGLPAQGLESGLVGHWTFDGKNMASNVTDSSGQGNNGYMSGFTSTSSAQVVGKLGQGLKFDGVNDFVQANSSVSSVNVNQGSYSLWLRDYQNNANPGTNNPQIISLGYSGSSANGIYLFSQYTGGIYSIYGHYLYSNTAIEVSKTNVLRGSWVHVALTWDSSFVKLYYNGTLADSEPQGTLITQAMDRFYIGSDALGSQFYYLNGSLDDVRVYNRVLSATEIQQLYNIGAASKVASTPKGLPAQGLESGLVGHWTFDGKNMASNVADSSGLGNNGYMSGFTSTSSAQVVGKLGQGLKFDGVDELVTAVDSSTLKPSSEVSISAWVKIPATDTSNHIIFERNQGYSLRISNKKFIGALYTTGKAWNVTTSGNTTVQINKWYYVTFTYTSGAAKIYVNGVQDMTTDTSFTGDLTYGGSSVKPSMGCLWTNGSCLAGYYFNGSLDDVRIYNRALSATEVQQLYNMGR